MCFATPGLHKSIEVYTQASESIITDIFLSGRVDFSLYLQLAWLMSGMVSGKRVHCVLWPTVGRCPLSISPCIPSPLFLSEKACFRTATIFQLQPWAPLPPNLAQLLWTTDTLIGPDLLCHALSALCCVCCVGLPCQSALFPLAL